MKVNASTVTPVSLSVAMVYVWMGAIVCPSVMKESGLRTTAASVSVETVRSFATADVSRGAKTDSSLSVANVDEAARPAPTTSSECVPDCGPGFRAINGRCVLDCPTGSQEINGRCERQNQCPVGSRLPDGQCQPIDQTGMDRPAESMKQSASAEGGCSTTDATPPLPALVALLGLARRRSSSQRP